MYSLRKWIFRPKRSDQSLLAGFFYADEELNMVATELDSFDGRKDPERCTALVNQLRLCQDKVLNIIERIMDDCVPEERTSRDFRVKFPDDVLQESLAGQLWFGAECLAAGSSIMNREVESASMRPLAKALSRHLDYLRSLLRDQCLRNINAYTERMKEALILFDRLFAEFELSYVSAMVPVKTMKEYDVLQDVIILFSETAQRALRLTLLTQDMVDDYDPALMFTIPRLAIVCGLLVYPEGPLNPDMDPVNMSEMFRPFQTLLYKIRELLWTLSKEELWMLEKSLCSAEEPGLYRENGVSSFPEDFDPYQDLPADRLEFTTDGAIGPPGQPASRELLGIDQSDYGCMSQSPSTMTIVANPEYHDVSDDDDDLDDHKYLNAPSSSMRHQDSSDSGMLSENTSISETMHAIPAVFENANGESRSLRHSVSWPEPTRRTWRHKRFSDSDTTAVGFLREDSSGQNSNGAYHGSTQEFNFHLPLNTELSSGEGSSHNREVPTISVEQMQPQHSLGSTRVFFTSDCNEERHGCQRCTPQISYVTETLNEVFVTDTSFQPSLISSVTSKPVNESVTFCSKCGNKRIKESNLSQTTSDKNEVNDSLNESSIVGERSPSHDSRLGDLGAETPNHDTSQNDQSPESEEEKSNTESLEKQKADSTGTLESGNSGLTTGGSGRRGLCGCALHPANCDRTQYPRTGVMQGQSGQAEGQGGQSGQGQPVHEGPVSISGARMGLCQCGSKTFKEREVPHRRLGIPRIQRMRYVESSQGVCSVCGTAGNGRSRSPSVASTDVEWDRESYASSETSSYNSDCQDDEEIALAIQAAELASRREARSRFKSPNDLIHRLFVCISGVADQLQTNYASDLRHILKAVFECNSSEVFLSMDAVSTAEDNTSAHSDPLPEDLSEAATDNPETSLMSSRSTRSQEGDPPHWVPDEDSPHCESCKALFTFVRRRHHCRNCGKIFCGRCSSNAVPLPHYGHTKPVRVCNHCFMFQVTPFTVDE